MGIVGFYGGMKLALCVFATSFAAGLIWVFGIRKVIEMRSEPLLLELPPYRKPLFKNVFAKSWIRMRDFVYIVIPLLALGGIAYGILDMAGLTHVVVEPLSHACANADGKDKYLMAFIILFIYERGVRKNDCHSGVYYHSSWCGNKGLEVFGSCGRRT